MEVVESITESDFAALAEFRYQIRRFLHFSETAARAAGIEPQQHQVLLAIKGAAESGADPSVGLLAERLQLQHHSTGELVDRLAERGLVSRTRAREDRRQVLVRLTPKGETELGRLSKSHLEELRTNGPTLVAALEAVIRRNSGD